MEYQKFLMAMIIIASIVLSGCSANEPVKLRQEQLERNYIYYSISPPLYKGDVIQYKYKDGSQNTATIQKVTPQSLVTSNGQIISLADVISLEKKIFSKGRTSAAIGVGIGVTTVVIVAAASTAFAAMAASI